MFSTIIDALEARSDEHGRGFVFLDAKLKPHHLSFAELMRLAFARGRHFLSLGLKKGDRIALIVPENKEFVLTFLGAISAGLVPVPMFPPIEMRRLDAYIAASARMLRVAGARYLITEARVSRVLWSLLDEVDTLHDILPIEDCPTKGADRVVVTVTPDDLCFLQFTSGSTADPKGVIVTHRNLVVNTDAILCSVEADAEHDTLVSWLPLYHDMGLIGFVVAPLLRGLTTVFIPTLSFVRRPSIWMETISQYGGTLTFAPNFALGLAAKRFDSSKIAELNLRSLRMLGCAAEPLNPDTMRTFIRTFAPAGLAPEALTPCYGMAESTLAVAFSDRKQLFRTLVLDRDMVEQHGIAVQHSSVDATYSIELVACGGPFPGHAMRVIDEEGNALPEGHIGEIMLSGPSNTRGYFENEEASRALIEGRWLHTGDLGFMHEGDVFISGRKKDLIIINGRNYYPQVIEWAVESVEGIRKGNVVAFATGGERTEALVVVAETPRTDHDVLAREVKRHVKVELGIQPQEVIFVAPGALAKTSSGKLQRRKTKSEYEAGTLRHRDARPFGNVDRLIIAKHVVRSALTKMSRRLGRRRH